MNTRTLLTAALTLPLAGAASAQVATSLVEVGDVALVNGGVTTVDRLDGFNVNEVGGYAVLAASPRPDGTDLNEFILGSLGATAPVVLASEGAQAGFTVDDFAGAPDIANDGTLAYRAGTTGTESIVVRGGQAVAVRGNPVPASSGISGFTYRVPNRVQITADGTSTSFTSSLDGSGAAGALFTDDGANAPLKFFFSPSGGNQSTVVSGTALQANPGSSSYEVSSDGTRFIAEVDTGGNPADDGAVAVGFVGGAVTVPTVNGSPVREDSPIASGSSELWDDFDRFGVANDGTYLFTGSLAGGDEYLAINGNIALRTGDTVGSGTIDGDFGTAELNNTGDYATIVGVGGGQSLVVNGQEVLSLGDAASTSVGLEALTGFSTGVDQLGITDAVDGVFSVYFQGSTASVSNALFVVAVPEPATAAVLAAGGLLLARRRRA